MKCFCHIYKASRTHASQSIFRPKQRRANFLLYYDNLYCMYSGFCQFSLRRTSENSASCYKRGRNERLHFSQLLPTSLTQLGNGNLRKWTQKNWRIMKSFPLFPHLYKHMECISKKRVENVYKSENLLTGFESRQGKKRACEEDYIAQNKWLTN